MYMRVLFACHSLFRMVQHGAHVQALEQVEKDLLAVVEACAEVSQAQRCLGAADCEFTSNSFDFWSSTDVVYDIYIYHCI